MGERVCTCKRMRVAASSLPSMAIPAVHPASPSHCCPHSGWMLAMRRTGCGMLAASVPAISAAPAPVAAHRVADGGLLTGPIPRELTTCFP